MHCIKRLLLSREAFSAWLSILSRSAYIHLDESACADHNLSFAVAVMLIPVVREAGDNQRTG